MTKENSSKPRELSFKHPFFVILSAIIIIYGGYIFGARLYELFH
jgi:hypothetical protein